MKIPSRNGWWLGVPPFQEPKWKSSCFCRLYFCLSSPPSRAPDLWCWYPGSSWLQGDTMEPKHCHFQWFLRAFASSEYFLDYLETAGTTFSCTGTVRQTDSNLETVSINAVWIFQLFTVPTWPFVVACETPIVKLERDTCLVLAKLS